MALSERNNDQLLQIFNNYDPQIQFTLETEHTEHLVHFTSFILQQKC